MFGEKKRTFKELQKLILSSLRTKKLTPNQISKKANIRWEVVSHQLILLKGQGYVEDFFVHVRFKIFSITKEGINYLRKLER